MNNETLALLTEEVKNISRYQIPSTILDQGSWHSHLYFAFFITRVLKPKRFVELGSFRGTSFRGFLEASKQIQWNLDAHAIDSWEGDEHAGFYGEDVYRNFVSSLKPYQEDCTVSVHKMRFDKALALFEDRSIDLLHIDGLHTYEAVQEDFEKWLPKMSEKGVVLFHDIMVKKADFGVWKFWDEVKKHYPSIQFDFCNGLGVIVIHGEKNLKGLEMIQYFLANDSVHERFRVYGEILRLQFNQIFLKKNLSEYQLSDSDRFKNGIFIIKNRWTQWISRILKIRIKKP